MYEYLDRSVSWFAEPDRFMLAAMRGWVAARRAGRCPCAALRNGFRSRAVEIALPDFALAMSALDVDGFAQLSFMPINCARPSDDEARLLALFALGRTGPSERLRIAAAALVREEAVVTLVQAVDFVAVAFAEPEARA